MDPEQTIAALVSRNEQLKHENEKMKLMVSDLTGRIHSFSKILGESTEGNPRSLCQTTYDERQSSEDLHRSKHVYRTSSPIDLRSFIQNSICIDTSELGCPAEYPHNVKERILGEIAHQLDRSILSHVFLGQKRFYGFKTLNIPDKIIELSIHPLSGKVDKGYQLYLTQRYTELMEQLKQLGYKITLHPTFIEFVVNTYGILKDKPDEIQTMKYNNPETLRKIIMTTAPVKLQEDLLLLLKCLCHLAEKKNKPPFNFYR
ncbi:hypothetical protein JOB18_004079 [Solea senegalensis]|uniref:Speriolin C-terminal domain-containing protein n=1 Tax=Solea senegalensis TaxID=28829 RepID=A0AAV6RLL6_SOLSE|nr:hypothetical protein JOB18_004079 [Solea senegalensis]